MKWQMCFRTNSSYLDCPIFDYETKSDYQMNVAIYNPSSNDLSQVRLAVPNDGFMVKDSLGRDLTSAIACAGDHARDVSKYISCWLNVEVPIPSRKVTVIQVFQQDGSHTPQPRSEIATFDQIESSDLEVTLRAIDEDNSLIELGIVEKAN